MKENLKNAGYSLEEIYFKMLNDELIRNLKERSKNQPATEKVKEKDNNHKEEKLDKAS